MIKGIDVSSYNGMIDWRAVKKEGWSFAILKVIRKDLSADKSFEYNWNECIEIGMPIQGVYNYTYAKTVEKAKTDARAVLKVLGSDRHPMVWLDYEDASLPKGELAADIINAYGDVITAGGCAFGIYFGKSYYESYLSKIMPKVKPQYRIAWEARYYNGYNKMGINSPINFDRVPTGFLGTFFGWQYSSSGKVSGINGNVDLNVWYVDIEATKTIENSHAKTYDLSNFITDSRKIWKVGASASAKDIVDQTVTVSTSQNRYHDIVTPLERYFKSLGYYTGAIEADNSKVPVFGNGLAKATILYQTNVVKAPKKNRDGILTAKGQTWRTLYGA